MAPRYEGESNMKKYSKGRVEKHRGYWRLIIEWRDDTDSKGRHRLTRNTGIRCYPDSKDSDGTITKRDMRGQRLAEDKLAAWREQLIAAAEDDSREGSQKSLLDYSRDYLAIHPVKPSTKSGYEAAIKKLNGTTLGGTMVSEVGADAIRAWEQGMRDDGLNENTIAHYHAFLAQVLKYALAVGDISSYPIPAKSAPRRHPKPINTLTSEQARTVIDTLMSNPLDPGNLAAIIALTTGMRRGEVCALRWQDVDLDAHRLHVVHALSKDHGYRLDSPKDPQGGDATRSFGIGRGLADMLARRRALMQEECRNLEVDWSESLYVLGSVTTGSWASPDIIGRHWSTLAKIENWRGSQGERVRFHDLRHSFATIAIVERRMDVVTLAEILGHRDVSVTLNLYAATLDEAKARAMGEIDSALLGDARDTWHS